ncbi:hypothetical protein FALCPG4_010541 [Fusarium falciforme]
MDEEEHLLHSLITTVSYARPGRLKNDLEQAHMLAPEEHHSQPVLFSPANLSHTRTERALGAHLSKYRTLSIAAPSTCTPLLIHPSAGYHFSERSELQTEPGYNACLSSTGFLRHQSRPILFVAQR